MINGDDILFIGMGGFLVLYAFLALGRIWYYSKQQVELLREIKEYICKT